MNYAFLYIKTEHMLEIFELHLYLWYLWLYHNVPYVWLKNCLEIILFLCLPQKIRQINQLFKYHLSQQLCSFLKERWVCNISFLNCHQNNAKGSNLCLQYRTVFFYCMPWRLRQKSSNRGVLLLIQFINTYSLLCTSCTSMNGKYFNYDYIVCE